MKRIAWLLTALVMMLVGVAPAGIEDGSPNGAIEGQTPLILKAASPTNVTFTVRNTGFATYFRLAAGNGPPGWSIVNNSPDKKLINNNKTATFSFTITPSSTEGLNFAVPLTLYGDNDLGNEEIVQTGNAFFEVMAPPYPFDILQPTEDQVLEGHYTITWGAPQNADTYTLEVRKLNGNTPVNPPVIRVTNLTQASYTGSTLTLQKGAYYQIEVTAKNEVGETKNNGGPRTFSVAPPPPLGSFSITAPLNNAVVGTNPFFSWSASANATSYRLSIFGEFNGQPATGSTVRSITTANLSYNYADPGLTRGRNYYVAVVALGEAGEKGSDSSFVKFTIPAIEAFTLISPTPEQTKVARTVSFKWNPAVGATSYTISIFDETSSGRVPYMEGGAAQGSGTIEFFLPAHKPLMANHRYSWEVTAISPSATLKNSDGLRYFNTLQMEAFDLLTPQLGRMDVSQTPTFEWESTPGAAYYNVQLAPSDNQGNVIPAQAQLGPSVNGTSWNSTFAPLVKGKKYFWRVFATDGANSILNDGGWRYFTVDPLSDFTLTAPADQATAVEISPQLQWQRVDGAIGYVVRLSIPGVLELEPIVIDGNINAIDLLDYDIRLNGDTTYQWAVDAVAEGSLRASNTRTFTTTFRAAEQFDACDIIGHLLGEQHFSTLDRLVIGSFSPPLDVSFYYDYIAVGGHTECAE